MRKYPERPIVAVGAVILERDRVLLVQRGQEPRKGEWSLPGGVVELGESLERALEREVQEETCVNVEVQGVVDILDSIRRDGDGNVEYHFVIVDYLCRVRGGTATCGSDADAVEWVERSNLDAYGLTNTLRAVIRKAADSKRASDP